MREICTSGSEGGGTQTNESSLPLFREVIPFGTACLKADKQMGMKNLLLKNVLLTFEFHNTVSGATDREIVPVDVGLDYHRESQARWGCSTGC